MSGLLALDTMNNNKYYVYLHRRKDNNEVFYVGKGCGCRANRKSGRSAYWTRIANKCGYVVEYVEKGLSEDDAFDLEVETIKFYRDNGHTLCNHTNGGEGTSGFQHDELARAQINKHLNSEEFKSHMKMTIGRSVLCSNGMVFDTAKDAELWLGNAPSSSKVSSCCRREKLCAGGFVWRYLDDCEDLQTVLDQGKDAFIEWGCQDFLNKNVAKRVYCSNGLSFDSGYAAVQWYNSVGYSKVTSSSISGCCNGRKKTLYGLRWSFEDEFSNLV